MADSKCFADLCTFFCKPDAKGIIVTDCKLDDALALWYFFLLNFSRPAGHRVEIRVFVIGIQDLAGGKTLVEHLFQEAKAHAKRKRENLLPVTVDMTVFVSKLPGPSEAPRHELDTYAPYHDQRPCFPQASQIGLKYFQDLDANAEADFVGVICQFFMFGVLTKDISGERGPSFDARMLDYIVPKAGGVLAFQYGFNTRLLGSEQEQKALWDALTSKVSAAGAKIVFISNMFSFASGEKKPGTVDPTSEAFVSTLKNQSTELWEHLFQAGAIESCIFSCDQMAKWIVGSETGGREPPANLEEHLRACRKVLDLGPSKSREDISRKLKAIINVGDTGVAKVLAACSDLHRAAEETCGAAHAEYLRRAKANLEKFGRSVEVTDGQHLLILFQNRWPVLKPVRLSWMEELKGFGLEFVGCDHDGVLWAAQDVDVMQTTIFMELALNVPFAHRLVEGTRENMVPLVEGLQSSIQQTYAGIRDITRTGRTATEVLSVDDSENLRRECERLRVRERELAQLVQVLEERLVSVERTYSTADYVSRLEGKKRDIESHVQTVTSRVQALEQAPQQEEALVQEAMLDRIKTLQEQREPYDRSLVRLKNGEQQLESKSLELMRQLEVLEAHTLTLKDRKDLELLQARHSRVQQHAAETEQRLSFLAAQDNYVILESRVHGLEHTFDKQEKPPSFTYEMTASRALASPEAVKELQQRAAAAEQHSQQLSQALERAEAMHQEQRAALQRECEELRLSFQARIDTLTLENESIKVEMAMGREALEHAGRERSGHQEVIQQLENDIATQVQRHREEIGLQSQQIDTHHNEWRQKLLVAHQQIDDHKSTVQGLEGELAKHLQAAQLQATEHAEQIRSHRSSVQGLEEEMAKQVWSAHQHAEQVRHHERMTQGLQEELVTAQAAHRHAADLAQQHQATVSQLMEERTAAQQHAEQVRYHERMTQSLQEELVTAQAAHRQAADLAQQHQATVSQLMQERSVVESAHQLALQVEEHQEARRLVTTQLEEALAEKALVEAAHKHTTLNMAELEAKSGLERAAHETIKQELLQQAALVENFKAEALAAQARAASEEQNMMKAQEAVGRMQQELRDLQNRYNAHAVLQDEGMASKVQKVPSLSQWQQAADAGLAHFDAGLAHLVERMSADQQRMVSPRETIQTLHETIQAQAEREQDLKRQVRELQDQLSAVFSGEQAAHWREDAAEARVLPANLVRVQAPSSVAGAEVLNVAMGPASGLASPVYATTFSPRSAADNLLLAPQVIQEPLSVTIGNPSGRNALIRHPSHPGLQRVNSRGPVALHQVTVHTPGLPGPGQVASYAPSVANQLSGSTMSTLPTQLPSTVGSMNTPLGRTGSVGSVSTPMGHTPLPPMPVAGTGSPNRPATQPAPTMFLAAAAPSTTPPVAPTVSPRTVGPSRYSGNAAFLSAAVPNFRGMSPDARQVTPVRRIF